MNKALLLAQVAAIFGAGLPMIEASTGGRRMPSGDMYLRGPSYQGGSRHYVSPERELSLKDLENLATAQAKRDRKAAKRLSERK